MYRIEGTLKKYEQLKERLSELHPEIEVTLHSCDYALASLGFVDSPPCVIHIDLTEEKLEALLNELLDIELASLDMPYNSYEQKAYKRYVWIYDCLFYAEYIDI